MLCSNGVPSFELFCQDILVEDEHTRISRFYEEAAALLQYYLETLQLELHASQTKLFFFNS
jgi:hypothetical protein